MEADNDSRLPLFLHLAFIFEADVEDIAMICQGVITERSDDQLRHFLTVYFPLRIEGTVAKVD